MRCVVTGAAGFVGSTLCESLLEQGHEVLGIDCFIDYYPRETKERNLSRARQHEKFRFIEDSLLSLPLGKTLEGAEWIFHQAGQAAVRASWGDKFSVYTDNNILATQKILEASRAEPLCGSLKKLVFASSSSVYGHAETLPTPESIRPQPISPYGVSKLAAEHMMVLYAREFNVPTVSLRYFTVYGPRQRPDMAFNIFIRAGLLGEELVVYGTGEQSRDFTFIDDIVRANIDAARLETPELVYNIGGGSRTSVNEVLGMLNDILGKKLNVSYRPRMAGDASHTGADTSLAARDLGFKPSTDLQAGLRAEASWMGEVLGR